jgi:hypothetical protein
MLPLSTVTATICLKLFVKLNTIVYLLSLAAIGATNLLQLQSRQDLAPLTPTTPTAQFWAQPMDHKPWQHIKLYLLLEDYRGIEETG